jgi:hypothetical protein
MNRIENLSPYATEWEIRDAVTRDISDRFERILAQRTKIPFTDRGLAIVRAEAEAYFREVRERMNDKIPTGITAGDWRTHEKLLDLQRGYVTPSQVPVNVPDDWKMYVERFELANVSDVLDRAVNKVVFDLIPSGIEWHPL